MKKLTLRHQLGYIKLYRKIKDHWLWKERGKKFSKFEAWVDLLFRANFKKDNEFVVGNQIIKQNRGEVFTSQLQLAEDWKWHSKTVKKFLELLKSDNIITYEITNNYTRIFITNYEKLNPITTKNDKQNVKQKSAKIQSKAKQKRTINKDNKYNNYKNI